MLNLPTHQKVIVVEEQPKSKAKSAPTWHDAPIRMSPLQIPSSQPGHGMVVVKIKSFAFNHRDVWIRKGLYPHIQLGATLGSDCAGTVVCPSDAALLGKDVLVYPAVNWLHNPRCPDVDGKPFGILGGSRETDGVGSFAEYITVPASHCIPSPDHLTDRNASAVPLAGLTAFRAVFTKGQVVPGNNVLITGIGGGVAIWALQLCVACGANVWVTSSSQEKIERACGLGAQGGVNYREEDWPRRLSEILPTERPSIDVVIDSGGGDIVQKCSKLLCAGGLVVNFGATSGSPLTMTMAEVLKNVELRGSTMGSLAEFQEMVKFISLHKVVPVVHKTLYGFEQAEKGFQIMKAGEQFGKIVVIINTTDNHKL